MVSVDANAGSVRQTHVGKFGPKKSLIISLMLLIAFRHLKSLWHTALCVRCVATVRSRKKDFFSPLQTLPIAV